ncbi:MAG: molecular chaperone TorD family protein [Pirellulales bacterium]|nr:molecular chaperone TorD family protein [Pirellulales bacterium]
MPTIKTEPLQRLDLALLTARQVLYRFASISFLDPKAGAWEMLRSMSGDRLLQEAAQVVRDECGASPTELGRGELALDELRPDLVLRRLPAAHDELNEQYEATFGLLVSSTCPPYETEYVNSKLVFQRSNALGDIAGFYRAFQLEPSRELPERHDHIVLELEFMAYVIGLEIAAANHCAAEWHERREICHSAQQRFLAEHLAWWTPAFGYILGRQNADGFYAAAGRFLAALIPADRALLEVPLPVVGEVTPTSIDRPDECEGCPVGA